MRGSRILGTAFARPNLTALTSSLPSPSQVSRHTRSAASSLPRATQKHARTAQFSTSAGKTGSLSRRNDQESRKYSTKSTQGEAPPFAFAFDIDGVLLHVATPIPGAPEALKFLNENNIPFILLTNGGGKHETERVKDLSQKLGIELTTDNFVQSHTPFRQLVEGPNSLREKTILVTGANAEKCRLIAEAYGFRNVVTPADILKAHPEVFPFDPLLDTVYTATARPLPKPVFTPGSGMNLKDALKIDAMFVFNDPRDWAYDIQLITDLLLSQEGYVGTYSPKNGDAALPSCGWQQDGQPTLYFSNADLLWSTGFHLPRFGQGAFQAAVAGVWRRLTNGHELQRRVIGKPYSETYQFAERVLATHRHDVLKSRGHHEPGTLKSVYMVGDNPESDIAGANDYQSEAGTEWSSVLVRTGVWSPEHSGEKAIQGRFKPKVIVDDAREAVRWALKREGWTGPAL
ncbi:HAD-like domain-containing protein [Pseudoneurospora amorphoporcata]|uniref:HAD-like domain-containing protein n=1 Tax=Pseudoneurospora amorphoporcata TaxID=241081 RepID=A0AAN6P5Y4_9PEZI|nr:HAD-like domain-containing protein [Pseudoneurospora amorphoporcata]